MESLRRITILVTCFSAGLLQGCHQLGYSVGLESKVEQEIRVDSVTLFLTNNKSVPIGHRKLLRRNVGTSHHLYETLAPSYGKLEICYLANNELPEKKYEIEFKVAGPLTKYDGGRFWFYIKEDGQLELEWSSISTPGQTSTKKIKLDLKIKEK